MTRPDLTEIVMIIDRSGSMNSIRADAEGGINSLIENQKQQVGEARLTLVQFDEVVETVHKSVTIKDVPKFNLVPRGWTALLDAVGRTINETGARLAAMPEADRPGLVLVVIVTDGEENHSREFKSAQIKEMIERQTKEYQWQFSYLGANQDAFAVGKSLGTPASATADFDPGCIRAAYSSTDAKFARMRSQSAQGMVPDNSYTDEERSKMVEPTT